MDVRIEGLRFERDRRIVLDIPSLSFRADRTTAILGPNGAGKTTLLRLIAGLERPAAGRILLAQRTAGAREARQAVAYVFQEHVFLNQSVRENLALGLKLRGVPAAERSARIESASNLLGMTHLLDRNAGRLSGGEGRRASLARALCLRAPLVLLDEPLAGLDPATYSRLLGELPRVLDAFRATTVFVTHDHREAVRLADDLVVLVDGVVRAAGDRQSVAFEPRRADVAGIFGYTVLEAGGRQVAISAAGLAPGPGRVEFSMVVDALLELPDHEEVAGTIGQSRVHVTLPSGAAAPQPGERLLVHADRVCDLGHSFPEQTQVNTVPEKTQKSTGEHSRHTGE